MRRTWGWLCLASAFILLVLALADYQREIALQRAEQERRDAHWLKVNQDAARQFPHALPGEAKPDPAPLQGMPLVIGLGVGAVATLTAGGALLVAGRSPSPV